MSRRLPLLLLAIFTLPSAWANEVETRLDQILQGEHRNEANRARDSHRHPKETLRFFDVQPDMTVVEIWPSTGWYTEILAPLTHDKGRYYAANFGFNKDSPQWMQDVIKNYKQKLAAHPQLYDHTVLTELAPPAKIAIAPAGSADRVLTFRNVHNWISGGYAPAVFEAMFTVLKPGGILGVVEHRAKPGTRLEQSKSSGYVTEAYVIELAEKAGFQLLEKSEINANSKDDTDHPKGVWTLPPSLRLGKQDREQYLAIGESDRMTLKFIKPQPAAPAAPSNLTL